MLRKLAMPMPFNPPSSVLLDLMGWLTNAAKGVVSTAEEKIGEANNNMPVGTAQALIEQGAKVFSAIHARLHRSQAKSLRIVISSKSLVFGREWTTSPAQRLRYVTLRTTMTSGLFPIQTFL